MRVLLLVAHGEPDPPDPAARQLDLQHAIAICGSLLERGNAAPCLVLEAGPGQEQNVDVSEMPHRLIRAGLLGAPLALWGILRQMRGEPFCIVAFGRRAIWLGLKLRMLARRRALSLAPVFLLNAPESLQGCGADAFLCGSQIVADQIAGALSGKSRTELMVCPPGLAFKPLARAMGRHFVFGMAQSLEPGSGALTVVRAMACVWQRENLPAWEMRMYGGGPRYAEILSAAQVLGVASRLCLLDRQDMPEALAQCSAWLAPGSSQAELPGTLWQGMACNIPVIASKSRLHLERLAACPGSATLVPERDPQALAQAMISLLGQRHAGKACDRGEKPFSLDAVADRWAKMIERLCQAASVKKHGANSCETVSRSAGDGGSQ